LTLRQQLKALVQKGEKWHFMYFSGGTTGVLNIQHCRIIVNLFIFVALTSVWIYPSRTP
jgi:hypothetical protein